MRAPLATKVLPSILLAGFSLPAFASPGDVFATTIQPILQANCYGCHNAKLTSGGLSLDSREAILKGGSRGPAANPGHVPESLIVQAILQSTDLKMPPGRKLKPDQIAALESWIRDGLTMPATLQTSKRRGADHWSFQPVKRAPFPAIQNAAWVKNPIDRFILAKLETQKLAPSPEADRATLLRRASLDLTGLPPTPQELTDYLADRSPNAYEKQVDRLLATPHYAEGWAKHWLDNARYSDSDGYTIDSPRDIWPYRDWVIQALNRDMPFDQFVIEQIAGDLLPNPTNSQLIATAFHRNTPSNFEGGIDFEQYRVEAVADRVATTGSVFLGLTTGCARCHDHKFDPISQREYYQLFAFFNQADEVDKEADRKYFNATVPVETDAELKALQEDLRRVNKQKPKMVGMLVMKDRATPRESYIHLFMAGGGLKPGTIFGASDDLGFSPAGETILVHDVEATVLHLLGLDHKRLTYKFQGRDFRLTDVEETYWKRLLRNRVQRGTDHYSFQVIYIGSYTTMSHTRTLGPMSLFYDLPEASCVVSAASLAILDWNAKADALFGLSGHPPGSLPLLERVQVWNAETFVESLEAGEFDAPEFRGVVGITAADGPVQLDLLISKAHWLDQPVYLIVLSDASSRVRMEEQLRQAQKMESVGMLAGGIAHDFNNLLTIISGYSHMLLSSLNADEANRSAVEQVIKASDRAAALTRQLLSFSRRQVTQTKTLDLNSVVQGMTPMLNRLIGEHIRLRISPGADLGSVRADQGQIEQVVMNLVVNARDAMSEGGNLWIETRNVDLDSAYVGSHIEARPGHYVMLAVTDSGTGMDRATREKVFEPFFTTKGEGKGTGLGLSMVYGIVKRSGGTIDIYSELGQGTAIKLYLPRANRAEASSAAEGKAKPKGGNETVLVVEDDDAVRATVKSSLATLGYRILPASSGEEAMEIAKRHEGVIDLMITDMVLPKIGGREVARRMHKRRPETVVLFMSGYTDVSLTDSGDPAKQVHFIGKPFTPSGLATRVRELLDARHSTGRHTSG